ncbi:MAG: heme exporter protein CcmB [Firmicutes bacterium]|nr:heme exporter protein CcmB [Bacillota bacterium]
MRRPLPFWAQVAAVVAREWRAELGRPDMVVSFLVYGLLLVLVFTLAVNPLAVDVRPSAAGLLWIGFFFAALAGFQRSFAREREGDAMLGLRAAPLDAAALYYGKLLFGSALLGATELVVAPAFLNLANVRPVSSAGLAGALALGSAGLAAVAALVAAVAASLRSGEALLPLLGLPLLAPLALGAVRLTDAALTGALVPAALWLRVLVAYDMIFLVLPLVVFPYIAEE